jgi:hypothetical protein
LKQRVKDKLSSFKLGLDFKKEVRAERVIPLEKARERDSKE